MLVNNNRIQHNRQNFGMAFLAPEAETADKLGQFLNRNLSPWKANRVKKYLTELKVQHEGDKFIDIDLNYSQKTGDMFLETLKKGDPLQGMEVKLPTTFRGIKSAIKRVHKATAAKERELSTAQEISNIWSK